MSRTDPLPRPIGSGELMSDGSHRSGLSQDVVSQIVRERAAGEAEVQRLREALHTICGLTHQDIDEEPFWRLVSRIHHVARRAVDPPAREPR